MCRILTLLHMTGLTELEQVPRTDRSYSPQVKVSPPVTGHRVWYFVIKDVFLCHSLGLKYSNDLSVTAHDCKQSLIADVHEKSLDS